LAAFASSNILRIQLRLAKVFAGKSSTTDMPAFSKEPTCGPMALRRRLEYRL
jgi:hypothetical protein